VRRKQHIGVSGSAFASGSRLRIKPRRDPAIRFRPAEFRCAMWQQQIGRFPPFVDMNKQPLREKQLK
jgi:hypothetical protein